MLEHCKVSCHACPRSKDDAMPSYEEAEEIYGPLDDYDDEDMQELDDLALRLEKYGVPQNIRRYKRIKLAELFTESLDYMERIKEVFSSDVLNKCRNESPSCAVWAIRGKCNTNTVAQKCAPLCGKCDVFLAFNLEGDVAQRIDTMSKEAVLKEIKKYGKRQDVGGVKEKETIEVIRSSLKYVENMKVNAPEDCINLDTLCAYWAAQGECEANPTYMNNECSLSCRTCSFSH